MVGITCEVKHFLESHHSSTIYLHPWWGQSGRFWKRLFMLPLGFFTDCKKFIRTFRRHHAEPQRCTAWGIILLHLPLTDARDSMQLVNQEVGDHRRIWVKSFDGLRCLRCKVANRTDLYMFTVPFVDWNWIRKFIFIYIFTLCNMYTYQLIHMYFFYIFYIFFRVWNQFAGIVLCYR